MLIRITQNYRRPAPIGAHRNWTAPGSRAAEIRLWSAKSPGSLARDSRAEDALNPACQPATTTSTTEAALGVELLGATGSATLITISTLPVDLPGVTSNARRSGSSATLSAPQSTTTSESSTRCLCTDEHGHCTHHRDTRPVLHRALRRDEPERPAIMHARSCQASARRPARGALASASTTLIERTSRRADY
jgi:hypothetical protein